MAIIKILKITSKRGIEAATKYVENEEKTTVNTGDVETGTEDSNIENVIYYASNGEKTEDVKLVTGINCRAETADIEMRTNANYWKNRKETHSEKSRDAFHIIQSFDPSDNDKLTPEKAHEIGIEFAKSLQHIDDHEEDPNRTYQMLVCTHVDKEHLHNHIILCSYDVMNGKMFHECKDVYKAMRNISDELCKKNGLKIIENPDNDRKRSRAEWEHTKTGTSWKDNIRKDIVSLTKISNNWDEFKQNMEAAGYQLREGKYITYTNKDGQKVRDKTLGTNYTKDAIEKNFIKEKETSLNIGGTLETAITTYNVERFFKDDEELQKQAKKVLTEDESLFYDENGKRRSGLEIALIMVLKMVTGLEIGEDDYLKEKTVKGKNNNTVTQTKINHSINLAKEYKIETVEDLEEKLKNTGIEIGSCKKEITKLNKTLEKSKTLSSAIQTYKEIKPDIDRINQLPEGPVKEQTRQNKSELLLKYKSTMATMYKYGCVTDKQITDFETRSRGWETRINILEETLKDLNKKYRDLTQLKSGIAFAKETGLQNNRIYEEENTRDQTINKTREGNR